MKFLFTALAIVAFICLIFMMPFMEKPKEFVAEKIGQSVEAFDHWVKTIFISVVSVMIFFAGLSVVGALPIISVVAVAVAVAGIVFAWWPHVFDSNEQPNPTTIGDEMQ